MKKSMLVSLVILTLASLICGKAFGGTIHVPGDYPTIQAGIDAASSGDTVQVAPGTYHENITMKSGVVIQGAGAGDDPSIHSIIDGGATGSVVTAIQVDSAAKLDGFTITNGDKVNGGGMYNYFSSQAVINCTFSGNSADYGGGMYNYSSSPTVTNSTFSGNSAAVDGGGMYSDFNSSPTVNNCTFSANSATRNGGGMYSSSSSPTVTNCTFSGNSANSGGGMYNNSSPSPTVTDCTFSGNSAGSGGGMSNFNSSPTVANSTLIKNSADYGGGMYNYSSSPTVTNCTFSGNSADYGGGIENNFNSSPTVTDCTFSGNLANLSGGGMYNYSSPSPTVTNCTFSGNSAEYGGGMSNFNSSPMVTNCTFSGNSATLNGGAMDNYSSSPTVTNCILWGDTPQEIDNRQLSSPVVTYSDVQGGYAGTGNIDTNPLFVGGGDYHLTADSPCIDVGTSSGAPNTDFEGDPRPQGTGYDMGADEFASCVVSTYYRDFDGDSYGDPNNPKQSCTQPSGYVTNDLDCDDTDPQEHPDQTWYKDVDSDGYSDGTTNTSSCTRPTGYKVASELIATSGDCNDNDQNQNPGAPEVCNGEDDNCNGEIDEGCVFNNPPEANAGSNQTVVEGETVTLDGSNSSDPDGDTISYQWTQIGGILATLSDPTAAKPTFVTPIVSPGGMILTFQLVVKDDEALQDSAQVIITVNDNGIGGFPDDVLTLSSSTGKEIGIKVESGGDCVSITAVDPAAIPDSSDKPENLPYGLFDLLVKADAVGGTAKVTFYLESQAGNDDKWFKYKNSTGEWEDCSAYASLNAARDQVTLTLVDGGDGDDGPADGWIVDPSGLSGTASTSTSSGGGGGGGGGCFIATVADD